jgi:hypothetical protein
MSRPTKRDRFVAAHVAPPAAQAPTLLDEIPLMIRLEREVEDEYRGQMMRRLKEKIEDVDSGMFGHAPVCEKCHSSHPMKSRGRKKRTFITRFGEICLWVQTYRCVEEGCGHTCRPLMDALGTETGRISGMLARLLALLGVVVPYELAARLAFLFFGVEVSAMSVWRSVQRLGAACEQYSEELARYHADPRTELEEPAGAPDTVLAGVDGCALGMQVRDTRRRRSHPDEELPPLPAVEEGHFREVKTGVLLLPSERVSTASRRSVVRRALVTCLGKADQVFDLLWSKLHELCWLGPKTVVVIVGDGAEWIWNRAKMFSNRCEILDFWHAVEKAWEFARLRYGQGSKVGEKWMSRLSKDLRGGKVEAVIVRLRRIKPSCEEEKEKLEGLIRYFDNNKHRMRYDEYLRLGYGIGSGAVESAHKQVTHARMRQAGMRWSEAGARRLLALRVLLLNDNWSMLDRLVMAPVV